jgi:hypothetical protein
MLRYLEKSRRAVNPAKNLPIFLKYTISTIIAAAQEFPSLAIGATLKTHF